MRKKMSKELAVPTDDCSEKKASPKLERLRIYRNYRTKSNFKGFQAIGLNWIKVMLYSFFTLYAWNSFSTNYFLATYFVLSILLALTYRGFENLVHEASHYNLFKTRAWNDHLQAAFAFPVFKEVSLYRLFHDLHHMFLGDKEKDPDMQMYIDWGLDRLTKQNFWWLIIVRPIFYMPWYFLNNTFASFWKDKNERGGKFMFWFFVILIVTFFDFWSGFLLVYVFPFGILLPMIRFWCESSEHIGFDLNETIPNSRNNLGFVHSIMHPFGDGYHQIHHDASYISWYHLPKVHKELNKANNEYEQRTQTSYGFFETFKLMVNKITIFKK